MLILFYCFMDFFPVSSSWKLGQNSFFIYDYGIFFTLSYENLNFFHHGYLVSLRQVFNILDFVGLNPI